ncbi:MAG: glycosyltransferase [Anaerolineae bacterium]|nr:MAG: glycosyltransferase [Anaerolineae bacterium]
MKLLIAAPGAIPARTANSIQTMKMAQAFAVGGHDVRVLVPGTTPGVGWEDLARHYGLTTRFEVAWLESPLRLRGYTFAVQANRYARTWGAHAVFTRHPQTAALAARRMRTILEIHDLPQGRMGPLLFTLFMRARHADRLVCISRALASDLSKTFGFRADEPFSLIAPDGVDLARYADVPEPESARAGLGLRQVFTAGYTGHLYPGRGADLILEIARRMPEINFLLVGGEPAQVADMRARAAALPNVKLTGFVPNADLPRYQAACDVLLMPYQPRVAASSGGDIGRYLSPMKMFEYLACARPILSSDLPVLREVLTEDNAVLLPPTDPQPWADALRALAKDPARRAAFSVAARATAEQHTWEARARRIIET